MIDVIILVLPFFGLIFIGYLAAKWVLRLDVTSADLGETIEARPDQSMRWLNIFIIYVALPALFFKLLSDTPIEDFKSTRFLMTTTYVTFLIFSITFFFSYLLERMDIGVSTIKGLAGAYGNIGYMGPGIALLAFGEKAAVPVALIFCIENILHFTMAPIMMSLAKNSRENPLLLLVKIVRNVVTHPFIIATICGIIAAIFQITLPHALQYLVDILAQSAAPCALFGMGVTLAHRPLHKIPASIYYIVPIKLVLLPGTMLLFLSLVGNFDPLWVKVAVLLASLPTATNVYVIGQQYGYWAQRASATIFFSTLSSVVTMSVWLWGFESGIVPADLFP